MPKIKIRDLPENASISQEMMKQVFGGSLMNMSHFIPPSFKSGESSITIRGFDLMHRLTRATESKSWSPSGGSNMTFINPNNSD